VLFLRQPVYWRIAKTTKKDINSEAIPTMVGIAETIEKTLILRQTYIKMLNFIACGAFYPILASLTILNNYLYPLKIHDPIIRGILK
jgi:hypothetical protein